MRLAESQGGEHRQLQANATIRSVNFLGFNMMSNVSKIGVFTKT